MTLYNSEEVSKIHIQTFVNRV